MSNQKIKPIDIYNKYIRYKNEANQIIRSADAKDQYSASGAGMCIRKHWYGINNYERKTKDDRSLRLLRLGTVLGRDFDKAINWYEQLNKEAKDVAGNETAGYKFYTESPVKCERLKLIGHFDLLIVDNNRNGYLYDYKTSHSFKFKQLFGRSKMDGSPSNNYEYQLGTYAFMIEEDKEHNYCDQVVHMENIYINKDNSVVKSKVADNEYKDHAKNYWEIVNKYNEVDEPPAFGSWSPAYTWECGKYCDFSDVCNSPYKKKE